MTMIYLFPDYDTLRLALTSGVVPPEVSLKPTVAGVDDQGRPWFEPSVRGPRSLGPQLVRLGVASPKSMPTPGEELANWPQAIPLVRDDKAPEFGSSTPVIFELPDATHLPEIVGEMLRLGVDRQSFRWLKADDGGSGAVLLRVIGPPYYTLLRAIDRDKTGRGSLVRALIEQAPRVWVEVGWTHPLVTSLAPQDGQTLLLRSPRDWIFLDDAPFRDIYDILDFKLPQAKLDWRSVELRKRLIVPLRLIDGDRGDVEMWVLRDDPIRRLDELVRDAKESLIQRLIFAVGDHEGRPLVVLRVRPSKHPPPQLVVEAEPYVKYLKLDNLFVPAGSKLHPVLRRDAVRKLLADDPAQITWLRADPNKRGGFIPESMPDDAFRPLQDWVDYVLDRDREALNHWVEAFQYDFDPFVCPEEQAAEPRARTAGSGRRRGGAGEGDDEKTPRAIKIPRQIEEDALAVVAARDEVDQIELPSRSQAQLELNELAKEFLAFDGALDDPRRMRFWPDMATRHAVLQQSDDAGMCWMNLLWEVLDLDVELADLRKDANETRRAERRLRVDRMKEFLDSFNGEEAIAWRWVRGERVLSDKHLSPQDIDRLLANNNPSGREVRAVIACLVWGVRDSAAAESILARLSQLQHYLEVHERLVSLRAVWLAWHGMTKLSHDALGLARVRDRIIERLVSEGYSAELNLPQFLRAAGHEDSERIGVIRNYAPKVHEAALAWCAESRVTESTTVAQTSGHYVDLIFAFGFARLGEATRAQALLKSAEAVVAAKKIAKASPSDRTWEVHDFLTRAFRFRIEQSMQGRQHLGPLSIELRDALDRAMSKDGANTARYTVDRLRQQSQILEPQERFDPYRDFTQKHVGELEKRLAVLPDIKDPRQLYTAVHELLKSGAGKSPTAEETLAILAEALVLSPRVGETLTLELLGMVEPALEKLPPSGADSVAVLHRQAQLLDRALYMAANYDRVDTVQKLWPRFVQLLQKSQQSKSPSSEVNRLFGQCLRSMRKLGLRDDIGKLIGQAEGYVQSGRSIASLQAAAGKDWPITLTTLLHLAGGWLMFGRLDKATEILDAARDLLFTKEARDNADGLFPQQYANLAVAYATVLGQAPVEIALSRITELLRKMRRLKDTFTTSPYYARLHLNIVEAIVLAIVNDDFGMGPSARRWMDDDEYLVRRRLHRDHRAMIAKS